GFLAAFFVAAVWPDTRFYCMAAGNLVLLINVVVLWRPSTGPERSLRATMPDEGSTDDRGSAHR
ncbi:MAG: hypothetical protein AAGC55_21650, partial [Myxococcota bacterium]